MGGRISRGNDISDPDYPLPSRYLDDEKERRYEPATGDIEIGEEVGFAIDGHDVEALNRAHGLVLRFPDKVTLEEMAPNAFGLTLGSTTTQPLPAERLAAIETWTMTGVGTVPDLSDLPDNEL